MIGFSMYELLLGALNSLIYGFCFSVISLFFDVIYKQSSKFIIHLSNAFKFKKGETGTRKPSKSIDNKNSSLVAFLKVISFSLGFLLLSYYSLDGEIRLYMLLLSLFSLKTSNKFSLCFIEPSLNKICTLVYRVLLLFFAAILFPVRIIWKFMSKMFPIFRKMV